MQLFDITIALQRDTIAQQIALLSVEGVTSLLHPWNLQPWKRPLNIVLQIHKLWKWCGKVHWYGYFRSTMILIAMSVNGREGRMGAGGEALRKFLAPCLFNLRTVPFLI